MQDTIIKGTGNSRSLRSVPNFLTLYPSYEAFAQALVAGTLPIDLGALNPTGVEQQGTELTKGNLLTDETAALYGKGATATPDDIFAGIPTDISDNVSWKRTYKEFTASGSWSPPSNMVGNSVFIVAIGGGGGGGGGAGGSGGNGAGGGGGSGYIAMGTVKVNRGSTYTIQIGAGGNGGSGGIAGSGADTNRNGANGGTGGSTSFGGFVTASGGNGGGRGYYGTATPLGTGNGGNGGNGGSGGGGGSGVNYNAYGTQRRGGHGGSGLGENGNANSSYDGGKGGDGRSLLGYPQSFLPLLIKDTTKEKLGGAGMRGGIAGNPSEGGIGGRGGIGDIIFAGSGGNGGDSGNGGSAGRAGNSGVSGALYIFYQIEVTL